jgi:hypothetical protein
MPLISTGKSNDFVLDLSDHKKTVGFWMTVKGARPVKPIRIFVTLDGLQGIDSSEPLDCDAFPKHRAQIEAAASEKFDKEGVEVGAYDGQPILTVDSCDLED